jgi:beta-barrel assembly-enhancing protease
MIPFKPKPSISNNVNVSDSWPLIEFGKLLVYCSLFFLALYYVLGLVSDAMIPYITPEQEKWFFKSITAEFNSMKSDPEQDAYVQEIVDRLSSNISPKTKYPFVVKVIADPNVNAFTWPGGSVVVNSGLMEKVKSEEELAFVIGHEMGHVVHQDVLRGIGRVMIFFMGTSLVLGPDNTLNKYISKSIKVSELQFSKQQEISADLFGLELMQKTYHRTSGGLDFFERELTSPNPPNWVDDFLSDHPDTRERIQIMKKVIAERHYTY